MAKQLDVSSAGQVITTSLHTEMQQSYLEYAMSVIVGRALPDVRDGLKPVHRRILYAMHELGLTPDRPYRKCARVVGDVLGKYHPHGDQSVYDALVRLVQEFSSRYPLLGGHGNFGSIDADPPAAMRYTETRLAAVGNEGLLSEIGEAIVDFAPNFDNSQQEPTVLPAQLPFLLLNGATGIAVGMATNIPPHNLNEVVDGLVALIDKPDLADEKLFKLIPGPDFPTGGEIQGTDGIWDAYTTGRGSIPVRGISNLEEIQLGKGRHKRNAIIITELPYQVNKAAMIEKIAELVNQGKIEGIADLRDESDRDGIRVVIELRRDGNPDKILQQLYRMTSLQSNFGVIFLALVNGQPKQMNLRQMLEEFLAFREVTLTRRYRHELEQHENRIHLVDGWLQALDHIDQIITILRNSPDGSSAKLEFQNQFDFSDRQADAILGMPLRRLTGMERQNLEGEFAELTTKITDLQTLLNDRKELLKALKAELRKLKKQYGDDRRTRILDLPSTVDRRRPASPPPAKFTTEPRALPADFSTAPHPDAPNLELTAEVDAPKAPAEQHIGRNTDGSLNFAPIAQVTAKSMPAKALKLVPDEPDGTPVVIEFLSNGNVRRLTPEAFSADRDSENIEIITQTLDSAIGQMLTVLLHSGKAYNLVVKAIPRIEVEPEGLPIGELLPTGAQGDRVISTFALPADLEATFLILLTAQGRIKRLPASELTDLSNRGVSLLKFKDEDELIYTAFADAGDQIVLATSTGRVLRLEANDQLLPIGNRAAASIQAIRVLKSERLVGLGVTGTVDPVLLVSAHGYAKRVVTQTIKLSQPGELGTHMFQFSSKNDSVIALTTAFPEEVVSLQTSEGNQFELCVDDVPALSKEHKGELVVELADDEQVTAVYLPMLLAEG
jgi:DNA gyrase subunit A